MKLSKLTFFTFALFLFSHLTQAQPFRVLQFNIWQEGTVVPNGFNAIVDEIVANKADIVTFSEVRNYKNIRFNERIVTALQEKGLHYNAQHSYDSGILSRFPIESFTAIMPEKDDHGSVYKALVNVKGKKIAVYTAHLDYLNAANYLPRGYDGNTWKKLPASVKNPDTVLKMNLASRRDEAVRLIVEDATLETGKGIPVILGGDFNEPSHRDWDKNTKDLFDHNGLVIPWHNTITLENAGFIDAYRQRYPNPVTHPGFTFPAYNKDVAINKLIWAPDADDRDRIDFIFYIPLKQLKLVDIALLGPNTSVVRGRAISETGKDKFIVPQGVWPTDHKAILVTFNIK